MSFVAILCIVFFTVLFYLLLAFFNYGFLTYRRDTIFARGYTEEKFNKIKFMSSGDVIKLIGQPLEIHEYDSKKYFCDTRTSDGYLYSSSSTCEDRTKCVPESFYWEYSMLNPVNDSYIVRSLLIKNGRVIKIDKDTWFD